MFNKRVSRIASRLMAGLSVLLALALLRPAPVAHAASLTVTTLADETTNGDGCSLREAITNANNNAATWSDCAAGSGADTITFNFSGTIRLLSALPNITDAAGLVIDGVGKNVTISGDTNGTGTATVPIFTVNAGAMLTLQNLTLDKGNADPNNCGGAILNDSGVVTVISSTISGNHASLSAGGICNRSGGAFTVTNSTFSGNSATWGGGISNAGALTVTNSTFSSNSTTGEGGGINNASGTATVINSTFSGNSAIWGGGIGVDQGIITVTNSTFSGNTATYGDSVYNDSGTVTFRNTILATGPSGANCSGAISNGGNNIDSGMTCGWGMSNRSMSNTNPMLGPLANNGGATQTMALLPGSPAIDGVTYNAPNGAPSTDQRGVARPLCARYDIGAYEAPCYLFLPLIIR